MSHKEARGTQLWGTFGRNPVLDTYTWVPVAKLSNGHIINILETQVQIPQWFRKFLHKELFYRVGNKIFIVDVDHYEGQKGTSMNKERNEEYITLEIGDKFWFSEDLREYEVVKETRTTYYACVFSGCTSSVIHVSKKMTKEVFNAGFTEHYFQVLELRIIEEERMLEYDKKTAATMRKKHEKEQDIADSIRL